MLFLRSTPDAWPYGDVAVIEIYTLQAMRGFLKVGAYSQFGWHHPGPLYFYLLVPAYLAAGQRAIGLAFGALAINIVSLVAIAWVLTRHAQRLVAGVALAALAVWFWRAGDLAASIWNPHIIVFAMAALIVTCAAVATGDRAAMAPAMLCGSFLMQAHVSTVPCCLALMASAATLAVVNVRREPPEVRRALGRSAMFSAGLAIALWFPAMVDELSGDPGNLSLLWRFFAAESRAGQSWIQGSAAWADMLTLSVRPGIRVPWGGGYVPAASASALVTAGALLTLIAVAGVGAHKAGQRFISGLCGFELLAALAGYWSVMRIPSGTMGDYQIFWISMVGALSWATLAALAGAWVMRRSADGARARTGKFAMAAGIVIVLWTGAGALVHARAEAVAQTRVGLTRKILSRDVLAYLERERIRRPLFHIGQNVWLDATCIIREVYKRHYDVAVDQHWVVMFGDALAADGREDVELRIVGRAEHEVLSSQPGRLIAAYNDVFVHAAPRR